MSPTTKTITVTVATPIGPPPASTAAPVLPAPILAKGPRGSYAVGTFGGTNRSNLPVVPPGRYRAEVPSGMTAGFLTRCSDVVCYQGGTNAIETLSFFEGGASIVEIQPSDVAISLLDLKLTPLG